VRSKGNEENQSMSHTYAKKQKSIFQTSIAVLMSRVVEVYKIPVLQKQMMGSHNFVANIMSEAEAIKHNTVS
jgi:hypothetical protein